jgi:Putative prokaryotic signal transducing protein
MSVIQIFSTQNEMEASIIKGNLESVGIKSEISPINNNSPLNGLDSVQNVPYGIFVEENKAEEAKKFLAERK